MTAGVMYIVWEEFLWWFYGNSNMKAEDVVVLVVYNGETCNFKWLWKLAQAPQFPCNLPSETDYFMKPLNIIDHYSI